MVLWHCLSALSLFSASHAAVINFESAGAVAGWQLPWSVEKTEWHNGRLLNATLAQLAPGDTLLIPNKTFRIMGGIKAHGLKNVTIQLDGTLEFSEHIGDWPCRSAKTHSLLGVGKICREPLACIELSGEDVTFTASGKGTLNGNGQRWWGFPGLGYLYRGEHRPRLLQIHGKRWLIENLLLKDSPYWTFLAQGIEDLEVRWTDIDAWRVSHKDHTAIDDTAFNTDGFDVSYAKNVWIHDCNVWNQDDSFCVKDNSSDIVVERVNSSGVGLTIGSIASNVNNVTFRNAYMYHTEKGVYMKFRGSGRITNVLYENVVMEAPSQFPIWIGPAQQSDDPKDPICHAGPCSLCWPDWKTSQLGPLCLACKHTPCSGADNAQYENITLRNFVVNNPKHSAGVLIAHPDFPMKNVVFDNVRVNNPSLTPFADHYHCENVQGVATGGTWPVPPCFRDETTTGWTREQLI